MDSIPLNDSLCQHLKQLYNCTDTENDYEGTALAIISVVIISLFSGLCISGLLANVSVLYVLSGSNRLNSVTSFYITNLAVSDTLFLAGIPFLVTTYFLRYWMFGRIFCKVYLVNTSLNQFASSLFLTVMSGDRYIAVCHPISAPKYRTKIVAKVVSASVWTLAGLMITPVLMYSSTSQSYDTVSCNMYWPDSNDFRANNIFILYSLLLSFVLPLALILSFYSSVVLKLRASRCQGSSQQESRMKPKRLRVTRLVMALIVVYIICWLPYWALQLSLLKDSPMKTHPPFMIICFHISSVLSYANSAINPVLYTFMSDHFKRNIKDIFGCFRCGDKKETKRNTPITMHICDGE